MSIGMNLRNSKRMSCVVEACFHLVSGNYTDYLTTVSTDGVTGKAVAYCLLGFFDKTPVTPAT